MKKTITILLILWLLLLMSCRPPLYYRLKNIEGRVYDANGDSVFVKIKTQKHLIIDSCKDKQLDTFLRSLTLARHGRNALEHLLSTSAKITIHVSEQVGVQYKDGKYRIIAGMTWLEKEKSTDLIMDESSVTWLSEIFNKNKYHYVYENLRIEIFKGSILYANDTSFILSDSTATILNWGSDSIPKTFSTGTIIIEAFQHPELLYRNFKELYYFGGLHEIYHTKAENIEIQENGGDQEYDAFEFEMKAFKKRKQVNHRKIRFE